MSAVEEKAMDSPIQSEEEEQKPSSEGGGGQQGQGGAGAGGDVVQGKRVKKMVERLDLQAPKQREKIRVGDGCGEKLGEIPRTNYQITKMKPADLKPLHTVLFDRPGKMASIKKSLRLFNGFSFDPDSEQFNKKRDKMLKSSNFTNSKLKVMCSVLDLEKKGTHSDLVDRILTFLTSPKSSGKRLPVKKKKKSKKKLSGDDSTPQTKKKKTSKQKTSSSSSSPKKAKAGNKSKAIVMDSSSDEDEEEEEEEEETGVLAEEKPSEKEEDSSDESEEESSKSKSGRTSSAAKKQPGKRPRPAGKKSSAPRKRSKKSSDQSSSQSKSESQSESDSEQQVKKKKPLAKTKKADSSSNSKNTHTAEDSSDDDKPLIKMIKKAPSDDQLKATLQNLLKEANLEEMTMKQICQRVFDLYPEHDLSSRKDFIKQTVKALLT